MIDPSTRQLIVAWIVSALIVPAAYLAWVVVALVFLGAGPTQPLRMLQSILTVFGGALVFQLLYGGFVYVVLKKLGLLKLPTALLGYLVPLIAFQFLGDGPPTAPIEAVPLVLAFMLALVGWFFVRPSN
jgi:hypothetical protein